MILLYPCGVLLLRHIEERHGYFMKADKKKTLRLLKTVRGQMDGIMKMVEEDRYCIDISHQLMASEAVLRKLNREILAAHLKYCVKTEKDEQIKDEKIDELIGMLDKLMKN